MTTPSMLRTRIMRRVWYSFIIDVVTSRSVLKGAALAVSIGLFRELVFVSSVINNFLSVPIRQAPDFLLNVLVHAFTGGELLTLLSLVVITIFSWTLVRTCYQIYHTSFRVGTFSASA